MKNHLLLFTLACIICMTTGCSGTRQAAVSKAPEQPQFIDNVYIAPHNKTNATADAITLPKNPVKRKKQKTAPATPPVITGETASIGKTIYKTSREGDRGDKHSDDDREDVKDLRRKYAGMLGVRKKDLDNPALYEFIDQWYGTNYKLGGCDVSGIDCSGFVQRLYSQVYGIDLVRTAMDQFSSCKRIKRYKEAEEGDLVFFKTRGKRITHVGVYLANDYFVHASTSQGVIISNLNEEYWQRYFVGAGRVPRNEQPATDNAATDRPIH